MKALFFVGLALLILGVLSLAVPIPSSERENVSFGRFGRFSIDVVTSREDKLHPGLSAVMILGGLGAMVAGKGKRS